MRRFSFFITVFAAIILAVPGVSSAARFIASSSADRIGPGGEFQVDIVIDPASANVNAVGGTVTYPTNLLSLEQIRDNDSVVNFWVDAPTSTAAGVRFSGITPGGIGRQGKILSLIFSAKSTGKGEIGITNGAMLLADGAGTPTTFTVTSSSFTVAENGPATRIIPVTNTAPPETFMPEIARDPNIFDGKAFVVFSTQDKGSGIKGYEVRETKHVLFDFAPWIPATSPYLLADQNLSSYVYVKAIDTAGNIRVERLLPEHPLAWYASLDTWFVIGIALFVFLLFYFIVWKKRS
ncbi:MAG: hypothetical protein KGH93_02770 [Patescibacteria group bacterium]|nr:cohesin domain-containing protein [Patescibacteria group bacterium]MDE1946093.1 hypothetical protein [Patescibacteria group bacterium]